MDNSTQAVKTLLTPSRYVKLGCYLDNPTTKEHFNNFLDYWKQACMVYSNAPPQKTLDSDNLWNTCISSPASTTCCNQSIQFKYKTCGRFLSDPLSLENDLSQKTLISLFSELVVRSVPVKLSADLSQRFLEKQKITTCVHASTS